MDATRGIWGGGSDGDGQNANVMDYVTILTTSNATDFGDLTGKRADLGGASDDTRTLFAGGYGGSPEGRWNIIDYVTTQTTANAVDFGDLTATVDNVGGTSNGLRGVFVLGNTSWSIDFVTIQTTGNAADFGDLVYQRMANGACSGAAA
jgi:hypothetical protein